MSLLDQFPAFEEIGHCVYVDPELFHPLEYDVAWKLEQVRPVCAGCPARRECLTYALTHDVDGIWAGTTLDDRRTLQQSHGINPNRARANQESA
jgi:WhiB family redox-sensing transcriptional regulator